MTVRFVLAATAATAAIGAMACAPALGSLARGAGAGEDFTPGTNGIAHYLDAARRVDVQLVSTDLRPDLIGGARLTVRLHLAPAPGSRTGGCTVELYDRARLDVRPTSGSCGAPDTVLTFDVPAATVLTRVVLRFDGPSQVTLPAV